MPKIFKSILPPDFRKKKFDTADRSKITLEKVCWRARTIT